MGFENKEHKSEIKTHILQCKVCKNCNFDNFEIIKKCKSEKEIKINEAFLIMTENPKLNKKNFLIRGACIPLRYTISFYPMTKLNKI